MLVLAKRRNDVCIGFANDLSACTVCDLFHAYEKLSMTEHLFRIDKRLIYFLSLVAVFKLGPCVAAKHVGTYYCMYTCSTQVSDPDPRQNPQIGPHVSD
jgi:hypothetical protein